MALCRPSFRPFVFHLATPRLPPRAACGLGLRPRGPPAPAASCFRPPGRQGRTATGRPPPAEKRLSLARPLLASSSSLSRAATQAEEERAQATSARHRYADFDDSISRRLPHAQCGRMSKRVTRSRPAHCPRTRMEGERCLSWAARANARRFFAPPHLDSITVIRTTSCNTERDRIRGRTLQLHATLPTRATVASSLHTHVHDAYRLRHTLADNFSYRVFKKQNLPL